MNTKVNLSVYLILEKQNSILLSLRRNTGYEDDNWMFVAGHVEVGESPSVAMCREAKEEIGINILPGDLEVLHVMHRVSNRENIDIFMIAKKWSGVILNQEPDKCSEVKFFERENLPKNITHYIQVVINNIRKKVIYSEYTAVNFDTI